MGRIVNNNRSEDNSRTLTDLCCDIYEGEYVLVLGGDVVLKPEYAGGNSHDYIIGEFRKEYPGNDLTSSPKQNKNRIRAFLQDAWKYDIEEVSDDLVSLLSTRCFRIVLTTTFDAYIETVLRRIYGDELRVMNIYDPSDANAFVSASEFNSIPPTLYYVFGKAESKYDYVFSENDAIKVISRWMSKDAPRGLINYLNSKRILAIGCKFDDWYFRFFWFCLRQDVENLEGDVAISLQTDISESDKKLAEYLKRINVGNKGNARNFIKEISCQLNDPAKNVYEKYRSKLRSGGVFISYASEDFYVVCQIYSVLASAGINVWFDKHSLAGGDHYDPRILNAIAECKVFIPILSRQTGYDIDNGVWRYYKDIEWQAVEDNKQCRILPMTLYGFDIRTKGGVLPVSFKSVTVLNWAEKGKEGILDAVYNLLEE